MADESGDEDDYFESGIEDIKEFGNHPLMQKAQKALVEQVVQLQSKLKDDLIEKNDEIKKVGADREQLGVQLYSIQQQLARLQLSLEGSHTEYNALVDTKLQEEEMLENVARNNTEQGAMLGEHKKHLKKYNGELEALYETINQIENYNEEVKSEIAITRRVTYKAEKSMQTLEKHKEDQDLYVDKLNGQIRSLQEELALHKGQIDSQVQETVDANAVVQDTVAELELIVAEKKQLMLQWKAALAGLSRRDEALSQATKTLEAAESSVHDYDVEIEATRRNIQLEQQQHETLVSMRDKLENELQWVEENLTKMRTEREQLQERYTLLSKSLTQTDAEAKKLDILGKQLSADAESLLQNLQIVTLERQKMEVELTTAHSQHSNVNKAIENLHKEQMKVLKKIHDKETEQSEVENEIERANVDCLNCGSLNDQLSEQKTGTGKELKEKETTIERYQVEIRQRNDEVEKKMYRVDRLNKKYEKMVESSGGEENLGPLENTVRNLRKEAASITDECKELERIWLKSQTEMVAVSSEADKVAEAKTELQARVTILTQQQLRLTKDVRTLQNEVKTSQQHNVDLQKDITKVNNLISSNHEQAVSLENANYVLEMECVEELKDTEKASVNLTAAIRSFKTGKQNLLDEIVETERQMLLWEKKIQLDKETRDALDPTVGQQESKSMEKEVHRMAIRLDGLKREQERLAEEMERAVLKRTVIAKRYSNGANAKGDGAKKAGKAATAEMTQAGLKKRIGILKKDARELAEETTRYTSAIEQRRAQLSEMTSELERETSSYGEAEETNNNLQTLMNDLLYQKQLNAERIAYRQKYSKRLREITATGIDISQALPVERRLLAASSALDNVREVISDLQQTHPHLNEVLARVTAMADPALDIELEQE